MCVVGGVPGVCCGRSPRCVLWEESKVCVVGGVQGVSCGRSPRCAHKAQSVALHSL